MNNKIICYYCNKDIEDCCSLQSQCCFNFYNIIKYRIKYNKNMKEIYCSHCFINNYKNNFIIIIQIPNLNLILNIILKMIIYQI